MATVVQMTTLDRVGGETVPVQVTDRLSRNNLIAAASKKFRVVTKQSRVYCGITGIEVLDEVPADMVDGFFVISGKGGWKGAARLVEVARDNKEAGTKPGCKDECAEQDSSMCAPEATSNESLLAAAQCDRTTGVVLLWKETQANGYLSNWAKSLVVIDGCSYSCLEQWIMACKAQACGDSATLQLIMRAQSPRKMKSLGRSLNDKMVKRYWNIEARWLAQLRGARAKFQQHTALAERLLRTGHKQIAEASPSDRIFGIGLAPSDPLAMDPANWRGLNILGKALMQVRDELRHSVLFGEELGISDGFVPCAAPSLGLAASDSSPSGDERDELDREVNVE